MGQLPEIHINNKCQLGRLVCGFDRCQTNSLSAGAETINEAHCFGLRSEYEICMMCTH